jgi:hypothetical protein
MKVALKPEVKSTLALQSRGTGLIAQFTATVDIKRWPQWTMDHYLGVPQFNGRGRVAGAGGMRRQIKRRVSGDNFNLRNIL